MQKWLQQFIELFKPHPERFANDPFPTMGAVNLAPKNAAVIEAAEVESKQEN